MRIPRLYFADLCRRSSYYVLITECIPFAPRGPCVATHSLTYVHIQVHPIRATRSVRTPLLSCVHTYAHLQEHPICVTRSQTWIALTSPGPSVALMLTIPGPHVIIACGQSLLQDGFAAAARTTAGNVMPCGLLAATPASATNVTAAPATVAMKAHVMGLPKGSAVPLPMLPSSGVECDPTKLEARIDWSVWQSRGSCNACISYTRSLLFACNSAHIQRE